MVNMLVKLAMLVYNRKKATSKSGMSDPRNLSNTKHEANKGKGNKDFLRRCNSRRRSYCSISAKVNKPSNK
jgi:hypothetical protein